MTTVYSSWSSKSYSWGTAKTRCRCVYSTTSTNTTVTVSVAGAVQCDASYNLDNYGVKVTAGHNGGGGTSAASSSATGVFDGGTGWKASTSKSYSFKKTTSSYKVTVYSKYAGATVSGYGGCSNSGSVSATVTIPALASYSIKYNANGGSGAPAAQTKWYDKAITLSTSAPTRTGYTFQGWATSSSGSVAYKKGATYTANASVTLYAVWSANTYTVTFDANGGSGAPAAQTKTYGVDLTLSSTKPVRTNYNFLGWGTSSSSTTVSYAPGASYSSNAAITLYAIWELAYIPPIISNFTADRCNSSGVLSEDGTYVKVVFTWKTDNKSVTSVKIGYKQSTVADYTYVAVTASGTSGNVSQVIGGDKISTDYAYNIEAYVQDSVGHSQSVVTVPSMEYIMDFKKGGKGVAIGKPSTNDGFEIAMPTIFENTLHVNKKLSTDTFVDFAPSLIGGNELSEGTDLNNLKTPGTYSCSMSATLKTLVNSPTTVYAFNLEVCKIKFGTLPGATSSGEYIQQKLQYTKSGEIWYRRFADGAWGDWNMISKGGLRQLWAGRYYMTDTHSITLSEPVSAQQSGISLVFSAYVDGAEQNYDYQTFFVPKAQVNAHPGAGISFPLQTTGFGYVGGKYLYVNDKTIVGNARNDDTGTRNGVTYNNKYWVLRAVFGA